MPQADAGLVAHTCVESTARCAVELGYDVTLVKDATADYSEESMHATLVSNLPNYASAIVTTEEVTAALSGGRPLEQSSSAMWTLRIALNRVPLKGTLDPRMGTATILSDTLFGRTRGAVLAVLYGHVGESFYLRQLARLTGKSLGPVQREVRQLVDAGLVARKIEAARTVYSANQDSPVFAEIKSLVTKTIGIHDVLSSALETLRRKINLAFVYGSVARSGEMPGSDVDLMVVGKVDFASVVSKLANAQKTLNREINPTVYSLNEFQSKLRSNFLKNVLAEKKLFIIGDENVLRELGEK